MKLTRRKARNRISTESAGKRFLRRQSVPLCFLRTVALGSPGGGRGRAQKGRNAASRNHKGRGLGVSAALEPWRGVARNAQGAASDSPPNISKRTTTK
jgi:hypothetical protein